MPGGPTSIKSAPPKSVVRFVHEELAARADAEAAREMAAYMRSTQPFYGTPGPEREDVFKEMCERYAPADGAQYRAAVLSLWDAGLHGGDADDQPPWPRPTTYPGGKVPKPRRDSTMAPPTHAGPREVMYAACHYASEFPAHVTPAHLPLFKRMVVEGGWWDVVDWVAGKLVGEVLLNYRGAAAPVMKKWVVDEDLWVRRTAIIAQRHHKEQTDEPMLFEFCLRCADERDFFIQKAIGWALRQHAKTNSDAVKQFLKKHRGKLATVSVREAGKHIGVKP